MWEALSLFFYQRFWHIVGDDVTAVISGIIHSTRPLDAFNRTNVAVIPKVKILLQSLSFDLLVFVM